MITEKLEYTESGRGYPVVFIHGYPLNSTCWTEVATEMEGRYRVITPDLRGFGKSPVPDAIYRMEELAEDVAVLLESLKLEKYVLVGHSMGGYVALTLARLHPERLTALGLICSQATADSEETKQNRAKQAQTALEDGSEAIANSMLPKMFAPSVYQDDEDDLRGQVRRMIESTKPRGIYGALHGMALRPDSTDLLPTLTMPTLVLTTDQDKLIPPFKSEDMAELLPNAQLVTVHDAGHMPMLEQPRATAAAILNFLDELRLNDE